MSAAIKVLIADDHALVRKGLTQLLERSGDIQVIAEAIDGQQLLSKLATQTCDLILLDMNMPGLSGPELISRLIQLQSPPILVLSMHEETQLVRKALAAGAAGYLTKDADLEILLSAIRKVAAGQHFIDPRLAQVLAFEMAAAGKPRHENLSEREQEVLLRLARGYGINEIADQLSISNKTVSTHKARLMEKMAFATNADLVKYAIHHRLVD